MIGVEYSDLMEVVESDWAMEFGDDRVPGGVWFGIVGTPPQRNPITGEEGPVQATTGEVWSGFYGAESNWYGQRSAFRFESWNEAVAWFQAVTTDS